MSYADNYAERNLGPYFEGALKISDAIRDGARLPQLEDLDVVKAVIDEHVTIADNREAERYANKIIMEWKEANNKTTVFGPFAPKNPQGVGSLSDILSGTDDSESSKPLADIFGGDMLSSIANLRSLQEKQKSATTDAEREEATTQLTEKSDEFSREVSANLKKRTDASESFHLCAKIIAMGPDSPLKNYYDKIMAETCGDAEE